MTVIIIINIINIIIIIIIVIIVIIIINIQPRSKVVSSASCLYSVDRGWLTMYKNIGTN